MPHSQPGSRPLSGLALPDQADRFIGCLAHDHQVPRFEPLACDTRSIAVCDCVSSVN
jgi:hypothetical protein